MFNIFEKIFSYLSNLSLNKKNKKHEEEYKIRKRNIEILDEIVKEFPAIVEFKKIRFKTEFQGNLEYSIDTELFIYEFENKNFSGIENTLKREETELGSYNREYKNNSKEPFYKLIKIKENNIHILKPYVEEVMRIYNLLKKYLNEFKIGTPMDDNLIRYYNRLYELISAECNEKNSVDWVKSEEIKEVYEKFILEVNKYVKNK